MLRQGVQGISELITEHALINLDFADVKAVMKNAGSALMGIGRASGENRATLAAQQAIESPLIEVKIDGARGVLFSVAGGDNMAMSEIQEAAEVITGAVSPDANIIFGASIRPELGDEIVVTVVATGFDSEYYRQLDAEQQAQEQLAAVEAMKQEAEKIEQVEPVAEPAREPLDAASGDFTAENRANMWDAIRTPEPEEDLDVPPTLRERLRGKKGNKGA